MFKEIYLNEFKKSLKGVYLYVFTAALFVISLVAVMNTDPGTNVLISIKKEWHNAPLLIGRFLAALSIYVTLITMVIVGRSVAKDFEAKTQDFFFTLPMSKFDYLGGRFFGSLTANLLVFFGSILGFIVGNFLLEDKYHGPFVISSYVNALVFIAIPNLFFIGSIFFALATLSRKLVMTYVSGVGLLLVYVIVAIGLQSIDNNVVRILTDPFGLISLNTITEFWTVTEINTNSMPLTTLFLLNRLIWISVSGLLMLYTFKKFKFISRLEEKTKVGKPQKKEEILPVSKGIDIRYNGDFALLSNLKNLVHLVLKEFRRVVFHPAFLILTLLAMVTNFVNFYFNVDFGGSNLYPLTSWYLDQTATILLYSIPLVIFFAGVIIWRERDANSNQLYDVLPISDWMSYLSKLFSLFSVLAFYITMIMLMGIFSQVVIFGWTDIEIGLYLTRIFGIEFLYLCNAAVVVVFILNLVNNKYVGYFISAAFFILDLIIFSIFKYDNYLLRIGNIPSFIYSNMNGWGHYAEIILWYSLYWLLFSIIIAIVTGMMWRKGEEIHLKFRWKGALNAFRGRVKYSLVALVALFLFTGSWIGYNKYYLNHYSSKDNDKYLKARYEKEYGKYQSMETPIMEHVELLVNFYPSERAADIKGSYTLRNKSDVQIDSVLVAVPVGKISRINKLEFSRETEIVHEGKEFGLKIHRFKTPLQPGETVELEFDLYAKAEGFSDNNPKNELAANGTSIDISAWSSSEYFPNVGFCKGLLIEKTAERKKYGLSEIDILPSPEEYVQGSEKNIEPFVTYNAVISTEAPQIVVSNGDLISKETREGRSYFHYRSDVPMACEIVLASGLYEVAREKRNGIDFEVYYYKKHNYNIERIMRGSIQGMEYCSTNFYKYPYNTFKVVELPEYMQTGAARSQPSLIIWRESQGFVSNVDDADGIDQLFGITVHELAHNWFPIIMIPANAEGIDMFSEALAEYIRAMCVEKEYGAEMSKRHRRREMNSYLRRRSRDTEGERPYKYNLQHQYYVSYQKGTAIMYALQNYIGEDNVNAALREMIDIYGFNKGAMPTSADLIAKYREHAPDSLQYVITDLFERITLFENKMISAETYRNNDNTYTVDLKISCEKFYADSIGNQTSVPLADYIDVGVYDDEGNELYLAKHKITDRETELSLRVTSKPYEAGIDPNMVLIDRNAGDNIVKVKENWKGVRKE